jgi:mono/diheme cytochrome c family protein
VPTSDLLARGKLIYEKTAGGVGCASCHGLDGKGKPEIGARPNRGASETQVRGALIGGVPVMSFIKLTDEEITAVIAYLQWLDTQP